MKLNLNKKLLVCALLALPPAANARGAGRVRWIMGTVCEIRAPGAAPATVSAAFAEIERWDRILSRYKPDSELSALNRSAGRGPFHASAELYAVTALALERAQDTGGAFDPTVLPLLLGRGPAALPLVGWKKVRLDPAARTIELPREGMGLDFGGIGKGWALDRAAEVLRTGGVKAALLNFGGQVLAIGAPEGAAGWEVEVPGAPKPFLIKDASVAVSGNSERPGHIVSPFNGLPIRRRSSVAVLAPTAARADGWSTALFVLGKNPPSFKDRSYFDPAKPKNKKGDRL
ncbi:MAG: FAD:protein FMN transferase [Elusimicrobia bacterium]|nr:FAD:protein FMN transferase [Elusimicrobiota bacterium]